MITFEGNISFIFINVDKWSKLRSFHQVHSHQTGGPWSYQQAVKVPTAIQGWQKDIIL